MEAHCPAGYAHASPIRGIFADLSDLAAIVRGVGFDGAVCAGENELAGDVGDFATDGHGLCELPLGDHAGAGGVVLGDGDHGAVVEIGVGDEVLTRLHHGFGLCVVEGFSVGKGAAELVLDLVGCGQAGQRIDRAEL